MLMILAAMPVTAALADARSTLDRASPAALGDQAAAALSAARAAETVPARLTKLGEAIALGQAALRALSPADAARARHELLLSCALHDRATLMFDPTFARQKADLTEAALQASRALPRLGGNTSQAYLLLGSAHEDLAALADDAPEENYRRALDAYVQAVAGNEPAARRALGRSLLKALLLTRLEPQRLGLESLEQGLEQADGHLRAALQGDPTPDGSYWLAQSLMAQRQWNEADRLLSEAVALARQQRSPDWAACAIAWATLPLSNREWTRTQIIATARQRAALLRDVPAGPAGLPDPRVERARIEGICHYLEDQPDEAFRVLTAGLPATDPASRAHVPLLLTRAQLGLAVAVRQNDWSRIAQSLADARRVGQTATSRQALAEAYLLQALARRYALGRPRDEIPATLGSWEQQVDGALDAFRHAIRLTPYRPGVENRRVMLTLALSKPVTGDQLRERAIEAAKAKAEAIAASPMLSDAQRRELDQLGVDAVRWLNERIQMNPDSPGLLDDARLLQGSFGQKAQASAAAPPAFATQVGESCYWVYRCWRDVYSRRLGCAPVHCQWELWCIPTNMR